VRSDANKNLTKEGFRMPLKNKVQLIAYPDRIGTNLKDLAL
jgi:hypothetical protein